MRLLLDLAGVLAHFDPDARLRNLAEMAGITVESARERVYGSGLVAAADAGEYDADGFRRALRDRLAVPDGSDPSDDDLDAAWASAFTPFPAVVAVVHHIRARGVPIGVLSNNDALLPQVLPRVMPEVFADVDAGLFFAGVIKAAKPDPRAWQAVLDAWEVPAGEVVFVDDTAAYAQRATELGLVGIPFTSPERLAADLAGVGLG